MPFYDTRDGRSVTLEGIDNPWKTIATEDGPGSEVQKEEKTLTRQEIERLLERRISFETVETPISEIIPWLQGRSGVRIILDPEAVEKLHDPRISLKVTDMPFKMALDRVLRQAGLGYVIRGGALFISTPENLRAEQGRAF